MGRRRCAEAKLCSRIMDKDAGMVSHNDFKKPGI